MSPTFRDPKWPNEFRIAVAIPFCRAVWIASTNQHLREWRYSVMRMKGGQKKGQSVNRAALRSPRDLSWILSRTRESQSPREWHWKIPRTRNGRRLMVADIFRRQGKSSGGTTRQQITTNALRVGAPRSLSTERVGASPFRWRVVQRLDGHAAFVEYRDDSRFGARIKLCIRAAFSTPFGSPYQSTP